LELLVFWKTWGTYKIFDILESVLIKNYLIFHSTEEVLEEIKSKAWRLYAAEWVVWPPAQIINFYLLPTRFRVLYDNTISLGYDVYTSYVKHDKSWFYLLITLGPTEIYIVHIYRLEQLCNQSGLIVIVITNQGSIVFRTAGFFLLVWKPAFQGMGNLRNGRHLQDSTRINIA
jgi:hypothetical protein